MKSLIMDLAILATALFLTVHFENGNYMLLVGLILITGSYSKCECYLDEDEE